MGGGGVGGCISKFSGECLLIFVVYFFYMKCNRKLNLVIYMKYLILKICDI